LGVGRTQVSPGGVCIHISSSLSLYLFNSGQEAEVSVNTVPISYILIHYDQYALSLNEGPINTTELIEGRPSFKGKDKDIVRATNIRHPIIYFEHYRRRNSF